MVERTKPSSAASVAPICNCIYTILLQVFTKDKSPEALFSRRTHAGLPPGAAIAFEALEITRTAQRLTHSSSAVAICLVNSVYPVLAEADTHPSYVVRGATYKLGNQQSQPAPKTRRADTAEMSRRWYFETSPSGKEQVIAVKRTHHHRHHRHHHRHHDPNVYKVSREEWNRLIEREQCLADTNRCLSDEVNTLRASLAAAQADAHNFSTVIVPQLQNQINVLAADNDALRRTIENAGDSTARRCREEERLCQIIDKLEKERNCLEKSRAEAEKARCCLEKENSTLRSEIADLRERLKCVTILPVNQGCDGQRDVEYWKEECRYWKAKFEDTRRRHDDTCGILEIRTEKMRAYEEILKRRRFL
ncbi:hypothetical protein HIM_00305 [Hirsutella minnesotensis 3608]|nr:hypothetical protein HIM_00305 [Hirsutella minnesotensis 3608]